MTKSGAHTVITGFMGCGKTEVARVLAELLEQPFVDLDDEITRSEERSPARLIVEDGEKAFRQIETNILRDVLNNRTPGVIALGGGAWIQEINRDLINRNDAITVWLDAPFALCWQRIVNSGEDRPLGRTLTQARKLFDRRLPIYGLTQIRIKISSKESAVSIAKRIQNAIHKSL